MSEATDDPVLGRYEDGLRRLRDLELRGLAGETVPPDVLVSEVRAIRDDMVADRRSFLTFARKIEERMDGLVASTLPRKPWVIIGGALLAIAVTVAGTVIGALLVGGIS